MPQGDDLDDRFQELVAQIGADERRRMRATAAREAREARRAARRPRRARPSPVVHDLSPPGRAPRRRMGRAWIVLCVLAAVTATLGLVVAARPDLLASLRALPAQSVPPPAESVPPPARPDESDPADPFPGPPAAGWAANSFAPARPSPPPT